MAVTDSFVEFVLEQLEPVGAVTPKRMFGGVELLFLAVAQHLFGLFRVDRGGAVPFVGLGGLPLIRLFSRPGSAGGAVVADRHVAGVVAIVLLVRVLRQRRRAKS